MLLAKKRASNAAGGVLPTSAAASKGALSRGRIVERGAGGMVLKRKWNVLYPLVLFTLFSGALVMLHLNQETHEERVKRAVQVALEEEQRYMRAAQERDRQRSLAMDARPTAITNFSTAWAHHESYGIIDDVLDVSWASIREQARNFHQYLPDKEGGRNKYLNEEGIWYIYNLQPNLNCPHLQRVGGHGDGPKWICNPLRLKHAQKEGESCLIYSIGSAGVYTWEDTLVEMLGKEACEIHVFDPAERYARAGDKELRNIHYHAWGLKSSYDTTNSKSQFFTVGAKHELKTFGEMVKELGHENRRIDILKIDCEGCEWYTYRDWIGHDIGQISIEIHGVPGPASQWIKSATMKPWDFYDAFTRHRFAMYAKEPNSYSCGKAVEYSFLKMHPDFWQDAPILEQLAPEPEPLPPVVNVEEPKGISNEFAFLFGFWVTSLVWLIVAILTRCLGAS